MLRELTVVELDLVSGGFWDGDPDDPDQGGDGPDKPNQEDQSVDDDFWWDGNDWIIAGAAVGTVVGTLICKTTACAPAGGAVGGYIGNRISKIELNPDLSGGTGGMYCPSGSNCGPVSL